MVTAGLEKCVSIYLASCVHANYPDLQIRETWEKITVLKGVGSGYDVLRGDFQTFSYGTLVLKGVLRRPLTFDSNLIF